jgi:deoxyuridine 5''-triphosphate nucleotidohydrolase (dut)
MSVLQVSKIKPNAVVPARATQGSAGYDLSACLAEPLRLPGGERVLVPTGIAVALPENAVGLVFGRSGLATKHGISPSNAVGVIDSDYRGEIFVPLSNHSPKDYQIEPGERIAQLVVVPIETPEIALCEQLPETQRGEGGFGSTGRGGR